ncbi:FecCD family ABC transporter permease [Lonepinella koalarum]|uniref:Iron complex transport system permease protein n=1 Tax=Lonepinella koalarum TaxID=53417 RepID=A0A4R1KPX1_9PAST|nr:iron ABC transporter permease [Lonepinella koalarum]MDH2926345.1 peptide ABC transporter substrate-binding protein [Lonepinella koalarum]TCK67038.1 iron complex transport system permease protein [Lonepinella koalarum]
MPIFRLMLPLALLIISLVIAVSSGQYSLSLTEIWQSISQFGNELSQQGLSQQDIVLWNIRLPRIATAILVGIALSVAGVTYQGMFKNPLVSPDILGVTSGAGLGAVTAIYFDFPLPIIQLFAFAGGLFAVGLVYFIASTVRRQNPILALVLSGVAISALLGAGISLLKILADPYSQLSTITFWLLGGLNMTSFDDLKLVAPLVLFALIPLILLRWRMNVLSLDDEEVTALGVNIKRTRLIFILCATLMTSAVVSVTGIIGWVGLIIPHIARLWSGADFRLLLPTCILLGSTFLLITDTLARCLFAIEIPLGVITAFVGAPFFLSLLIKGERQ